MMEDVGWADYIQAMQDLVSEPDDLEWPKIYVGRMGNDELKATYKASKQLSDLCWQEIRRRRDES